MTIRKIEEILEVIKIAEQVRIEAEIIFPHSKNLAGACLDCTGRIERLAKEAGVSTIKSYYNGTHAFTLCSDFLIDVTATQFNITEKVVVKKYSEVEPHEYWWVENPHRYTPAIDYNSVGYFDNFTIIDQYIGLRKQIVKLSFNPDKYLPILLKG